MVATGTFGHWMKQRRKAFDLTQEELALQVGCSLSIIEKIESGVRRPSKQIAALLAESLQVPLAERTAFVNFARAAQGDEALDRLVAPTVPAAGRPPCPYRGLAAFRAQDAAFFFGRAAFVERLAEAVRAVPLANPRMGVALVGASGSGKSSVAMAGLAGHFAALAVMRPGTRPLQALAAAPGDGLLVVDQFEELYTLCPDAEERQQFVDALLRRPWSADRGGVVLTLRADFLGHALSYRPLADALQGHTVILGPMNPDEMRQAIEGPAVQQGVQFEAGLVKRILRDAGDEPGTLPLLEFALTALWEQDAEAQPLVLTHNAYDAIGGVTGALVRRAEEVYAELGDDEKELARRVFTQLVQPGEGTEDMRRQATRSELGEEGWGLAQWLAGGRLTVIHQETVEVAHEALIAHWGRLREWLAADRQFRAWQERLRAALRQWQATGRDEGALLRGAPLAEAEGWLADRSLEVSAAERAYVGSGLALRDRETAERQAQSRRELEAAQKLATAERQRAEEHATAASQLRQRALYLAGALIVAALLAVLALGTSWQANENAQVAQTAGARSAAGEATAQAASTVAVGETNARATAQAETEMQRKITFSRELAQAALANLGFDPERSVLLALEALSVTFTTEAEDALRQSLPASNLVRTLEVDPSGLNDLALSSDGTRLATTSKGITATVWETGSGQPLFTVTGLQPFYGVDFSPDGRLLATSSPSERMVTIWDATAGVALLTVTDTSRPYDLAFSPDSTHLAVALLDVNAAKVWRLVDSEQGTPAGAPPALTAHAVVTLSGHTAAVQNVAFNRDGTRLVTASSDQTLKVWNVPTGEVLATFVPGRYSVTSVIFSPDGTLVAAGDSNGVISIFEVATGQKVMNIPGHEGQINSLDWSADGARLVSGAADGLVRVWDVWRGAGRDIVTLVGHKGAVIGVAFDPAGAFLFSGSNEGIVKVWDSTPRGEIQTLTASPEKLASVLSVAYSPDGTRLATSGSRAWVKIWDGATGAELLNMAGHDATALGVGNVIEAAFSPAPPGGGIGGTSLATMGLDGQVILWDAATGHLRKTLTTSCTTSSNYSGLAFNPAGTHLAASCSYAYETRVWDVASGNVVLLITDTARIRDIAYSPDGLRLAGASNDHTARIWDASSGELLMTLGPLGGDPVSIAYSPDGTRLAVAGSGPLLEVWDPTSGALLLSMNGHQGNVTDVTFSPDSKLLATASEDKTAKVWDVVTGEQLFTVYGHRNVVFAVSFSPDGRHLATASLDRTARIYTVALAELVAVARTRLTRGLTEAECRQYLHVEDENIATACPP